MTFNSHTWESTLLALAHEGHTSRSIPALANTPAPHLLEQAYAHCQEITAQHSRSFYLASALLEKDKRRAVRALYAFCRTSDDLVDNPSGNVAKKLAVWRVRALETTPPPDDLVAVAWADAWTRYKIPPRYIEQLLDGVGRDLHQNRYETFEDLAAYSYGVASTVGLMSMHITGFSGREAIPYAVKLGVALQVTNILRDVGEDWRNNRLYLPQQELAEFGLSEADLDAGHVTNRWRAFMRFQVDRNRRLYEEAWPGLRYLHPEGRFAIGAAGEFYRRILDDIEAHDYDVFNRRAYVSTWGKLRHLPRLWWQLR